MPYLSKNTAIRTIAIILLLVLCPAQLDARLPTLAPLRLKILRYLAGLHQVS